MKTKKELPVWRLEKPLLTGEDYRSPIYQQQLIERGFSDMETWNLNETIAAFILPRLQHFLKCDKGHPFGLTPAQWDKILGKMIYSFTALVNDGEVLKLSKSDWKKYEEGLKLFAKYFRDLWR